MNIEDLQETARLAHLNLDEAELAGAFPAFEQMLGFFAAMQAADEDREVFPGENAASDVSGSGVSRTVTADHFRPDNPCPDNNYNNTDPQGLNENLLNNAGDRDGRFIVIPNVL
jgi:aspartyl-tRNA(Asn)/glutamyl-tRNA(Gln) amidotransferase subunit C